MIKFVIGVFIIFFVALFAVTISSSATSAATIAKEDLKALNETLERYRSTVAVEGKLKQEISNILDQTTTSEGRIWLSRGKMKIHFDKPELVDVVFDGEWLWQAQKTPEEFGGQWQVLKMKTNDLKRSNAGVALLFGTGKVESKFTVAEVKKEKSELSYFLKPKDLKKTNLKKILVVIDKEAKKVVKMKLEDQAETVTKLSFSDTVFGAEVSPNLFKYTPPKGSEVNIL